MPTALPMVILGGRDKKENLAYSQRVHEENGQETLTCYKGAELRIFGQSLIQNLAERVKESRFFSPVYVAGPSCLYKNVTDYPIIDTDSSFGKNIQASLEYILDKYGHNARCGIMACDILPKASDISDFMESVKDRMDADIIYQLVEKSFTEGKSAYKPKYALKERRGLREYLPGHLVILKPANIRLNFIYDILNTLYSLRLKDTAKKIEAVVKDLSQTLYSHPIEIFESVSYGLAGYNRFRKQALTLSGLEISAAHIFVRLSHRLLGNDHHVHIEPTRIMSFARDFDTKEEFNDVTSSH
jgi:hypothetical protein